jgi:hypothetical protein
MSRRFYSAPRRLAEIEEAPDEPEEDEEQEVHEEKQEEEENEEELVEWLIEEEEKDEKESNNAGAIAEISDDDEVDAGLQEEMEQEEEEEEEEEVEAEENIAQEEDEQELKDDDDVLKKLLTNVEGKNTGLNTTEDLLYKSESKDEVASKIVEEEEEQQQYEEDKTPPYILEMQHVEPVEEYRSPKPSLHTLSSTLPPIEAILPPPIEAILPPIHAILPPIEATSLLPHVVVADSVPQPHVSHVIVKPTVPQLQEYRIDPRPISKKSLSSSLSASIETKGDEVSSCIKLNLSSHPWFYALDLSLVKQYYTTLALPLTSLVTSQRKPVFNSKNVLANIELLYQISTSDVYQLNFYDIQAISKYFTCLTLHDEKFVGSNPTIPNTVGSNPTIPITDPIVGSNPTIPITDPIVGSNPTIPITDPIVQILFEQFIVPASHKLYPDVQELELVHATMNEYTFDTNRFVGLQTIKEASVVFNLCLGDKFKHGCDVVFYGKRCRAHVTSGSNSGEFTTIQQKPGTAVLYRGTNRHRTLSLMSGRLRNLVIYCRAKKQGTERKCALCFMSMKKKETMDRISASPSSHFTSLPETILGHWKQHYNIY